MIVALIYVDLPIRDFLKQNNDVISTLYIMIFNLLLLCFGIIITCGSQWLLSCDKYILRTFMLKTISVLGTLSWFGHWDRYLTQLVKPCQQEDKGPPTVCYICTYWCVIGCFNLFIGLANYFLLFSKWNFQNMKFSPKSPNRFFSHL